tara:strand:+ start:1591 stop:1953 length:363 start_codon:yes stop_codon:yes gene_type:complete
MNYFKIFSLGNGESEVEELKFNLSTKDFIKGTPSFPMADLGNANALKVACVPNGWDGGWHSTPMLQWVVTLSGAAEMQVSSGKVIKLVRGVSVLLTDTTGKGHHTTVVGDEDWCSMLISI